MATQVKIGGFVYRINPDDDRELQRRTFNGNSWSFVNRFNGYHILDLLLALVLHLINIKFTCTESCKQSVYLVLGQYVTHEASPP